jgi:Tannase and feruloyl esterase
MKRLPALLAAPLPLAVLVSPAPAATTPDAHGGAVTCRTVAKPRVPGARILSLTAVARPGGKFTFPANPSFPSLPPIAGMPPYCEINVLLTHPEVGDRVRVAVWLPLTGWNGRFQGTGGGGFAAGLFDWALGPAVKNGYAAASTDAGVGMSPLGPPTWALHRNKKINQGLLTNFARRSVHEMSLVGKQVTARFYGRPAAHSYWNGCSTGGRQGLMEAQRYPRDFDGILAAAPAINWDRFLLADFWPQVLMNETHTYPTACEFDAFNKAAIAACDRDDGVADGVIGRPETCRFDPYDLAGRTVTCAGQVLRISMTDAEIVRRIWAGPRTPSGRRLWYGLPKGTPLTAVAATAVAADGTRHGVPFPVSDGWIKYFLKRDPGFDTSTIGLHEFEPLFRQSQADYGAVLGTDDPDLSAFRDAGGKMITWHGLADQLISSLGTVDYRRRVEATMGGARATDRFYRVFLAPGADHCAGGVGPVPTDPLAAVVAWVEKGRAPDTLPAATTNAKGQKVTRNLCRYPLISRYTGSGDPNSASNYVCVRPDPGKARSAR